MIKNCENLILIDESNKISLNYVLTYRLKTNHILKVMNE